MNKIGETIWERLFLLCAIASVVVTVLIFGFMVVLGLPLFKGGQFFHLVTQPWAPSRHAYGIYPMIVGTVAIASLGVAIAFPVSLGCASLISVLAPRLFSQFLRRVVQLMTGVPTVIYGFVGVFLLVPLVRDVSQRGSGMCILSAALMLAVLISPTMILFFADSFEHVPRSYLNAVDALGGRPVQKFIYVMVPCAWKGILTGCILGIGRALGDTLIALMIAGNAIHVPNSPLDSARVLTAHIALVIAADYDSLEFKSIFACGVVLYVFTTLVVLAVRSLGTVGRRQEP
jgi:phosphate transport system permease protein